ncbi:MAG: Gfo/Idh/MocA family oxidoreductase [Planctomycetes bacterium]|nr:Gfo/Idh/MocA family oxidoreductase [Planctomycetota bacterium]
MNEKRENTPHDPKTSESAASRRQFLATSALFAGAAAALSAGCESLGGSTSLAVAKAGKRTPVKDGEPIRIGVIGVGGMGTGHLEGLLATPAGGRENLQVVAISDVAKPKLEGAVSRAAEAQKLQVDGYRDYRELLARKDIHGVLIASPEHQHAPMTMAAVAAGKDIYCEKPFTFTIEEALAVRQAVEQSDLVVQIGTQHTMIPKYVEAQKLIAAGAIGHPTLTQTSYCRNSEAGEWLYDIDPKLVPGEMLDWDGWLGPLAPAKWDTEIYHRWRRYKRYSAGIMGDLLVHQMTPLMMALDVGWPVQVFATGGHYVQKDMENQDQVFVSVQFEKEHTMVAAGSTCNELGLETIIRGHKGNLFLGSDNIVLRPERTFAEQVDEKTIVCEPMGDDQNELRLNWLSCMRTREPVRSPVSLATQMMVVVDLGVRSLWDGKAWMFDPKTQRARSA